MFEIYKKLLAVNQSQRDHGEDHKGFGSGSEASGGEDEDDDSVSETGGQRDDQQNLYREAEKTRDNDEDRLIPENDSQQDYLSEDGSFEEGGEDTDYEDYPDQEDWLQQLQAQLQQLEKKLQDEEKRRKINELWHSMVKASLLRAIPSLGRGDEQYDSFNVSDGDGDDEEEGSPSGRFSGGSEQNKGRLGRAVAGPNSVGPGGDDHNASSDNRDGEDDDEQVEETLPLTDRLFQTLFRTQGNPVILFGNSFSIKSTFNTANQEFELEFKFNDLVEGRHINIPLDDLEDYKSTISQQLFPSSEGEEDEEQQQQQQQWQLDNLIEENFNDNLQAPLLKDHGRNSIAELILQSIWNADSNQYEARLAELGLSKRTIENPDHLIKYYAKMLSPFSATISPTFTRQEKDNFLELLRQSRNPALTDYLRSLRDHSPAYQHQQAFGLNARITDDISQNVFIEQGAGDIKPGKVWVEEKVKIIKDQVDQEIRDSGDQSSCQQVRILFTENYLTQDEFVDVRKDASTPSAMIIVHVNKFEVTQNVIAKTKEEYDQDFYTNYENMAYGYRAIYKIGRCNYVQKKLTDKFLADTGLTGEKFLDELLYKLESSDPNDQNMQGRIAKYFYEMGALRDEGQVRPLDQGIKDKILLSNLAKIKLGQDYLDSQINARPDYLRMENSCEQNDISPLHYDEGNLDQEAYKKNLNYFKIHFGDSPQDLQNGEPPFHEGSIKITRAKNNPNFIDIVRVIPKSKEVAKKFHDVQYVAIKDENGDLVERDLCFNGGVSIPSKYFFRKVTLSEGGPKIDEKLFYYDDKGKINSVELTNLDQTNEGVIKLFTDLVQMKIRATTVCGNSIESKFSAIDHNSYFGLKFVDKQINPRDYELNEFILKKDNTSSADDAITGVNYNKKNKDLQFRYQENNYGGFSNAVIYAHGAVDQALRQEILDKVNKDFEAIRKQATENVIDDALHGSEELLIGSPSPSPFRPPADLLRHDLHPRAEGPRGGPRGGFLGLGEDRRRSLP